MLPLPMVLVASVTSGFRDGGIIGLKNLILISLKLNYVKLKLNISSFYKNIIRLLTEYSDKNKADN
jgi:hypothetical protein